MLLKPRYEPALDPRRSSTGWALSGWSTWINQAQLRSGSAWAYGGDIGQGLLQGASYGAIGGAAFGAIGGHFGKTWNLWRVGLETAVGGGLAEFSGGDFAEGAAFALATSFSQYAYNKMVGSNVTGERATEPARPRDRLAIAGPNVDQFGSVVEPGQTPQWHSEGQPIPHAIGRVAPFAHAGSRLHDRWGVRVERWGGPVARTILNVPSMVPAAAITYAGGLDSPIGPILSTVGPARSRRE